MARLLPYFLIKFSWCFHENAAGPLAVFSKRVTIEAGWLVHCNRPPKQKFDLIAYNMNAIRKHKPQGTI